MENESTSNDLRDLDTFSITELRLLKLLVKISTTKNSTKLSDDEIPSSSELETSFEQFDDNNSDISLISYSNTSDDDNDCHTETSFKLLEKLITSQEKYFKEVNLNIKNN